MRIPDAVPGRARALLLVLLVPAAGARAAPAGEAGILDLALRSPHERAGDHDALAAAWLEALPAAAGDFRAEIIPRRLAAILPSVRDPQALVPLLEKAAEADHAHGSVLQEVLGLLAEIHQAAGRDGERMRIEGRRGFLRQWLVIGPFGKDAGSPFEESFPPEDEIRIDRTYQDGWQTLSWRKADTGAGETAVHPAHHAYPPSGVVYFLSRVECREALDALLLRSSRDSLQVWLDGKLVADDDAGAAFLDDVRATPVRLRAGWNRILVKTRARFAVQLAGPGGHPLPPGTWTEEEGLEVHPPAGGATGEPAAIPSDPAPAPPGAVEVWSRWVDTLAAAGDGGGEEAARLLADARMGLAIIYQARGRDELAVAEALKALDLRPGDPALLHHAGVVFGSARYLPQSISRSRSKAAFEEAVAADPGFLPAVERSARHLEEDEQYARAAERMREGLAQGLPHDSARGLPHDSARGLPHDSARGLPHDPARGDPARGLHDPARTFLRGLLRLQSIYSRKGWEAEEIETVNQIEKVAPASPAPARFWAGHYASLGNIPESTRHLRRAFELDRRQLQLLHEIHHHALLMGKVDEAEAALREAVRRAPGEPRHLEALAELLAGQDRADEALEVARRLAERNPADPRGALRIAAILDRAGRHSEADGEYRRALALEPRDLDLKRYLAHRGAAGGEAGPEKLDAFWAPYDARLEDWTAAIPDTGPLVEKAASIFVLDITVLRVEVDGSHSEYVHQAFKLLSEESKEELATVPTPGEVVTLRTLTADGQSLEPVPGQGKRSFVMPGLEPGAIIEVAYRRGSPRRPPRGFRMSPFFFQDTGFRQSVLLSRYVVLLPQGFEPGFIETLIEEKSAGGPELARVEKTVRELEGGGTCVIYEARNVPRLEREAMLPPAEEIFPNVALLEKQSWADVAGLLRSSRSGAARPTPELAAAAAEATRGIEAPLDRARAIYRHVNELVAKGGGPGHAAGILLEKAGDRTVLFKALCDLAGVPAHWAFLRPSEDVLPRAHWSWPRPEMFPYPFVAIEAEGKAPVFVSLSARGTPFGRLPETIEGGKALVLLPHGERIEPIPARHPGESAAVTRGTLRLGDGLDVEARIELTSQAVAFHALKDQLRTFPAFQKDLVLRQMAAQFFPGARVKMAEMQGLDDPEAPPAFVLDLTAPKLLKTSGDDLLLKTVFRPSGLVKLFGGRSVRELPLHLTRAPVTRDEIRVEAGETCEIVRTPRDVLLASALGEYAITYRTSGGAVVVERELTLRPGRLEPGEYPDLLEFSRKVDAAEEESIVFRRRPAP